MATLYDLIRWVRNYVGDPHHQPRLMADEFCWHQLCVAMDTIEDTDCAVTAYVDHEFPTDTGEKYLRIYGILQGLFVQQDALVELINAIRPVKNIHPRDLLSDMLIDVRGARNKSVGHPVKLGRKAFSTHAIVQHSMRKDGFELVSYPKRSGQIFQSVPVMELIEKQRAETFRILSEVVEDLRAQEEAHRAKIRGVKLMGVFDQAGYAFEKIFEELRRDSAPVMGTWGVGHLRTSLDNFEKLLNERGLKLDSYDSVKYLYDEIEHPLTELRKFLNREESEVLSNRSAIVFAEALQSHFDELRHIAGEIDEEYASEPEPVIPPRRQDGAEDIQIIFTTIGGPEKVSSGGHDGAKQ
jgi:hypothetical protein